MWRVESLVWSWLANALALGVVIVVFHDVSIGSVGSLLTAAALFGILNSTVKPLLKLITFPLAVITLRLIWFFVSMFMLKLTDWIVSSFNIDGFWALVWATIVVWVVNIALDIVPGPWRGTRRDHRAFSRRGSKG